MEPFGIGSVGLHSCGFVPAPGPACHCLKAPGCRACSLGRPPGTSQHIARWPGGLLAQGQEHFRNQTPVSCDSQVPGFSLLAVGPSLAVRSWVFLRGEGMGLRGSWLRGWVWGPGLDGQAKCWNRTFHVCPLPPCDSPSTAAPSWNPWDPPAPRSAHLCF